MIKTNSKIAKENIKNYIMNGISQEYFTYENDNNYDFSDYETVKELIRNALYNEKIKYDMRKNLTKYDYFKEWAQGLPSAFDTDYYWTCNAVDILGDILQETEEEKAKYTEDQAAEMLTRLLFREIF